MIDESMRDTDVLARYGGDEFVVVMPQTDLDGACILGERIRAMIQTKLSITVSGGVASAQYEDTQENLLTRADTALYQAKIFGRNCVFRHEGNHITQVSAEEVQNVW
jgi:diguanylate cyclase (GGDEF)-like protein